MSPAVNSSIPNYHLPVTHEILFPSQPTGILRTSLAACAPDSARQSGKLRTDRADDPSAHGRGLRQLQSLQPALGGWSDGSLPGRRTLAARYQLAGKDQRAPRRGEAAYPAGGGGGCIREG